MTIAPHCRPGAWRNREGWIPARAWPENCYVQWGGNGVVISTKDPAGSYTTAFFEAMPKDPRTFIRGEGASVKEAEANAYDKFTRATKCDGHEFERRKYRNGAGFCKHCDMFCSNAFEPIDKCSVCDTPTNYSRDKNGLMYCEEHRSEMKKEDQPEWMNLMSDD